MLILRIWETQRAPADFKNAIITIFNKGDCSICGNCRSISLLSIAGKIFARILLNCLQIISVKFLPESKCGFPVSRGMIHMILCTRQLQEKSREQQKSLFLVLRPGKSLRHFAKICYVYGSKTLWLPWPICSTHPSASQWHGWKSISSKQHLWGVLNYQWTETRMCTCSNTLLSVPGSYASRTINNKQPRIGDQLLLRWRTFHPVHTPFTKIGQCHPDHQTTICRWQHFASSYTWGDATFG